MKEGIVFIHNRIPNGTIDYLPKDIHNFRVITDKIRANFIKWGYQEVNTPIIEYVDVLASNLGNELVKNMFKFQDFDGELLALRSEMTIPIVRLVASKLRVMIPPIRLFYIANVFRYNQSYIEREREFWQAGVELLGGTSAEVDGEIIALLVATLEEIGLKNYRIDVGYLNLIERLLSLLQLPESDAAEANLLIKNRDLSSVEKIFQRGKINQSIKSFISQLLTCRTLSELTMLNVPAELDLSDVFDDMAVIFNVLRDYNCLEPIYIDFTLSSKIEYYTGIIFEVTIPEVGLTIGSGGRYDHLIEKFSDSKLSGIGFAIEIEKCVKALLLQNSPILKEKNVRILIITIRRIEGIKLTKLLRQLGCSTSLNIAEIDYLMIKNSIVKQNYDFIIFIESEITGNISIVDLKSMKTDYITIAEIERLLGEI